MGGELCSVHLHPNLLAAYVSWQRLFLARDLALDTSQPGEILDFGSSIGELRPILGSFCTSYHCVEGDGFLANSLARLQPDSTLVDIDASILQYQTIFALDSLEHNDNYAELIEQLAGRLSSYGVLIISGPTENLIYRLGRKLAHFKGDYYKTTIFDIEQVAAQHFTLRKRLSYPCWAPLFRLSAWSLQ